MRALLVLLLSGCAALAAPLEIQSPADGAVVPLLSAEQKAFLAKPRAERTRLLKTPETRKLISKYGDRPQKVKLAWTCTVPGVADVRWSVKVRRASDQKVVYSDKTHKFAKEIDNLEIATEYIWRVKGKTASGQELVARGKFTTEDVAPRLVWLDGIPNMRDFGGRPGRDGKRVKQGMIYRSGGLNSNAGKYYTKEEILKMHKDGTLLSSVPEKSRAEAEKIRKLLDAGKESKVDFKHLVKEWVPGKARLNDKSKAYAKKMFGIRTDIDLRTDRECFGMTESPLGPDVKWVHVSSSAYGGMASKEGKDAFREVFKVFLDAANYPIDFHCIAGADRTGAVGFILGALLGVDEEELWRDWEVTAFQNPKLDFNPESRFIHLVEVFQKCPGATIHEKVESYVKALGFTEADISHFRSIMLDK